MKAAAAAEEEEEEIAKEGKAAGGVEEGCLLKPERGGREERQAQCAQYSFKQTEAVCPGLHFPFPLFACSRSVSLFSLCQTVCSLQPLRKDTQCQPGRKG